MLTIYRRHLKSCEHRNKGRGYRRCKCPVWADGFLKQDGELRQSLGTRDWYKALDTIREWEERGTRQEKQPEKAPLTIREACEKFLAEAHSRQLAEATLYKYRLLFRQIQSFAAGHGLRFLAELDDLETVRSFRATWTENNLTHRNKLERLRTFLRFCVEAEWITKNRALQLKAPKVTDPPTLPLTRDEIAQILAACHEYPDRLNAARLNPLLLLLRYSGLRIRDAVSLSRERIAGDKLFLRTMKTGTVVWVPLPPVVIDALNSIPAAGKYFFWTGEGKAKSCASSYQRALHRLFKLAGVPHAHAHRFRDTFAVEMLLSGVPLERVAVLLGHSSIRVTEKHYAPWVRARQEQLESDVRRAWATDLIASGEMKGTPEVHGKTARPN